jgi:predicted DNA-binding transcriptional regulator AlpA
MTTHDPAKERLITTTYNLCGVSEIADMLGVSRQRAFQISTAQGFPIPLDRLASGPVWRRSAIEKWAEKQDRTLQQ